MLKSRLLAYGAFGLLGGMAVSCSTEVAGGVSEETNTLAGVLTDHKGHNLSGVAVVARHMVEDTLVYADTTDDKGRFAFPLHRQGGYGISASADTLAFYSTVEFLGKKIEMDAKLRETVSFKGRVLLDSSMTQSNVVVTLPGTPWVSEADSAGNFSFEGIPVGTYAIVAKSPDPIRYLDAAYVLDAGDEPAVIAGPLPTTGRVLYGVDSSACGIRFEKGGASVVQLPLSTEYGLLSWWSMDYAVTSGKQMSIRDARGRIEAILLYGDAELVEGVSGKALALNGADQFGVIENDNGALGGSNELYLELLLQVDSAKSTKSEKSYRRNIVGKLGFGSEDDHDIFSLALIKGECGVDEPHLAFFLADGSGDSLSCRNAVVSKESFDFGTWTHVVVVFESGIVKMYKNGILDAEQEVSVSTIQKSDEPIFFGKENLNLKLDDVRLGEKAITSADVLYRYYLSGGAI